MTTKAGEDISPRQFPLLPPFSVVSHDAGAANILAAGLASAGAVCKAFVEGPARAIWRRWLPNIVPEPSLPDALSDVHTVVTGTGWSGDLEHVARRIARQRGLRTIAVIDHWTFYEARFTRNGETVLPDEIWITDDYAHAIAARAFPAIPLKLIPNLYLKAEIANVAALGAPSCDVLYILEPARDTWGRKIPGEFQGLDYFASRLPALDLPAGARIRLRLHPSEAKDKYDDWIGRHSHLGFERDDSAGLAEAIARAGTVVGLNSFGLVVALGASRRVVSTLPPWATPCYLPHAGLLHLKDM